jgi:hypothetical protein
MFGFAASRSFDKIKKVFQTDFSIKPAFNQLIKVNAPEF